MRVLQVRVTAYERFLFPVRNSVSVFGTLLSTLIFELRNVVNTRMDDSQSDDIYEHEEVLN